MSLRTRIRSWGPGNTGQYWRISPSGVTEQYAVQTSDPGLHSRESMTDIFGSRDDAFTMEAYYVNSAPFSVRQNNPDGSKQIVSNWSFDSIGIYPHVVDPNAPSVPALAVLCLKRTNPSRPHIDLPVSLFELKDLPSMVKKAGESALERMASQTLNREFAWKPFMGDIKKLFQFQDKVQKRIELLNKFKEGPLLRKTELYSSVLSGPTSLGRSVISAAFGSCVADVMDYKTFRRYWGYVTYTPTPAMDNLLRDDAALRRKAINIVGGITVDASTIWQALPWSWLADWYGNLGDYLEAHRNLLPLTVSNPSICRTTRTVVTLRIRTPWVGKFYPYEHQFVWKERIPSSASLPSADLPLLTGRQIGILGSLAVLRGRGSSRL